MKTILCAVDDTDHSKDAVKVAADLAKSLGAKLSLITVNPLLAANGRGGIVSYLWDEAQCQRFIDDASAAARPVVPAATAIVKGRDISRSIVDYAEDHNIDHIVVGSGEKGRLARTLLGSVSNDVVNRAHCPVTVAR